ncbi:hypothetical protein CFC21_025716 [Triticum aestivum]|uniref:Receptor-like serine/threonine-protein kinase n=2 Tax=Triticum aestivum TaxID=4565 RepID=A0A3B6CG90_WHEAT|nr:G-type lectin S-receptor-like serine/threonine-protein kinase At4g27290 isoform X1 [Triticum aestivum]XP_044326289.1 G-type lectin S-receptor-like serine/threonine-protein kinase At4g27290 isoform X1 [Triticum aestivum]KAF7011404.1 hypothetical protein CFC21_025716 [Triticum aestivum]
MEELTSSHLLSLLLCSFLALSPIAFAAEVTDTLGKGQNVSDGETLVSAGGSFTLGFFSPGVAAKRYLGIWFTMSEDVVSWVANADRPLTDAFGVLVISGTGSLLLLDSSGQVVWSSNTTGTGVMTAHLLNSGNLVLSDGSGGAAMWQSFDHLSNTQLPGMKIGKNLWTGAEWRLTSWRSLNDPSPGNFHYTTNLEGVPQNVLLDGDKVIYRTGPWNGQWFSGVTEMATYSDMFAYQLTNTPSEVTYGYVAKPGAPLSHLLLTHDGVFRRLVWEPSSLAWKVFFQGPRDICDDYGKCGAFGMCNANAPSTSFCNCIKGFSPTSPVQWKMRGTSNGCHRNVMLDCGNGTSTTDGFVVMHGVKLPDTRNASADASITLEECSTKCLANCSCLGYAALDIRGGGVGTGCIIWKDDLMDLRYVDGGQTLYLRSAKSELAEVRHPAFPTGLIIGPSIASLVVVLFALWLFAVVRRRRRESRISVDNAQGGANGAGADTRSNPALTVQSVRAVGLPTIIEATGNFSEANIIGEGEYSVVYKGQLHDDTIVAVKRLKHYRLTNKGREHFSREVEMMSKLMHANLAKLLCYCQEADEWILVYEWMERQSLNLYIFGEENGFRFSLNWGQRLGIIRGIAVGVKFLHGEGFIHRDLKPGNILVSDTWHPKIADFATAKLFIDKQTNPTLVLTPGYVAPEYSSEGALTYKCDVYSFGVLLLEIVSGKRRTSIQTFLLHAWELWNQRKIRELLDPQVGEPRGEVLSGLARCIQIGLLCVQHLPEHRPSMPEVVAMLSGTSSQLPTPCKPTPNSGAVPGTQPGPRQTFLQWLFHSCGRDFASPRMVATV